MGVFEFFVVIKVTAVRQLFEREYKNSQDARMAHENRDCIGFALVFVFVDDPKPEETQIQPPWLTTQKDGTFQPAARGPNEGPEAIMCDPQSEILPYVLLN